MSKSITINNRNTALQSFNRYNNVDIMSAENLDAVYAGAGQHITAHLDDSSQVVPKYQARNQQDSGFSEPTAATSNQNYLTFDGADPQSPKAAFKISNQNALLSLISHDDLEGIRNQIHSQINKIEECQDEENQDDAEMPSHCSPKKQTTNGH